MMRASGGDEIVIPHDKIACTSRKWSTWWVAIEGINYLGAQLLKIEDEGRVTVDTSQGRLDHATGDSRWE